MAVQVSYPGVYIEEVPSGVHTITGVSTSIAAFFGRTARGPLNKAERILSPSDFTRTFGGPHPASDLAQSVQQFFANGGTDCYVIRLAHNAQKADVTLINLNTTPVAVLTATAKTDGVWGNALQLEVDYNTRNPDETFNLRVIYEEEGRVIASESHTALSMDPLSPRYAPDFVSQNSSLIDLALAAGFDIDATADAGYSESRRPLIVGGVADALNDLIQTPPVDEAHSRFQVSINGSQFIPVDLRESDAFAGDDDAARSELESRINTRLNSTVPGLGITVSLVPETGGTFNVIRITAGGTAASSVRVRRSSANDLAGPLMLGVDQGGVERTRHAAFRPVPNGSFFSGDLNLLAAQPQNAFNRLTIGESNVDFGPPGNELVTTIDGDLWYEDGLATELTGNCDGIREKMRIITNKVNSTPRLPFRAEWRNYYLAFVPLEGTINTTMGVSTSIIEGAPTAGQFTANVRRYALGPTGTSNYQDGPGALGLDDDGNPPYVDDYLGNALDQTGFYALDSVDLFNLMVLPGDREVDDIFPQIIGPASIYCQQKRAFLLVDAPATWSRNRRPVAERADVDDVRRLLVSGHSAVFYPRIEYSDAGLKKAMGPSGLIAGLMARIDSTRGVWKAPAGIEADLRGILDLQVNLTDRENGVLNKLGVNCLRKFPSGFVNWGARTMAGSDDEGSEWKYIPIRRLALFLEESLYRGTKWVVFEPNDEPLWAQIRLNLNAFMMGLFRRGAFQGSTPDKAFFVKCDSETTTQNDRNQGIVNIEVGFAPLKPAEFVIIRIQQMAGELG